MKNILCLFRLIVIALLMCLTSIGQTILTDLGTKAEQPKKTKYAPKDYYLIDSLDLGQLNEIDRLLVDSCLNLYHKAKDDTSKVNMLSGICGGMMHNDWTKYQFFQLGLIKKILKNQPSPFIASRMKIALTHALSNVGYIHQHRGDITEALNYYDLSLKMREEIGDQKGIAHSLLNIGSVYVDLGDISKGLDYYHRSLKIREKINDRKGIAISLNNIGSVYDDQGDAETSLKYHRKSLKIQQELGNKEGIAMSLNNIGYIYYAQNDIEQVLNYYHKSLKISEEIDDKEGIALSLNNLGYVYKNQGNIIKGLDYYTRALEISEEIGNKEDMALGLNHIGKIELEKGGIAINDAKQKFIQALRLAREVGYPKLISSIASNLHEVARIEGNYAQALKMYELHILMRDSVDNQETRKATIYQQIKYEFKKAQLVKEHEAKEKKRALTASIRKNKLWMGGVIGSLLLLITAGVIYYLFQKKRSEALFRELQNQALRLQINPHFLFNAMNAINSFIGKNDAINAKKYLSKFSKIMRLSLDSVQSELVPLESEIEFIKSYMDIEMIRNKNFNYEIRVDENLDTQNTLIPPILIQPYIENSILHGFVNKNEENKGRLEIEFKLGGRGQMEIIVQDNGIGIKEKLESKKHKSLALKITQKRLNVFADKKVQIGFEKAFENYGTRVSFIAPLKHRMA